MNIRKKISLLILIIILASMISACSGRSMVASGWAGLTTDQETAYLALNNHVHAINLTNVSELWKYPTEPDTKITFYSPPVLTHDNQLIIGGYDGVLYSLNPDNGSKNWEFTGAEDRFIGGVLVTNDGIFAPSADHKLYAIDFDGSQLWQPFETDEPIWAKPSSDGLCNCIYLTSMDHHLYKINSQRGSLLWKTDDLGGAIVGSPATSDGIVYVGTFGDEMLALDNRDGEVIWRFPTQDWVWAGGTVENDILYFGDISGAFYALNINDGSVNWQTTSEGAIVGSPLVTDEGVYFTTEAGSLVSVSLDGKIRWTQSIDGSLYSGPSYAEDTILVPTTMSDTPLIAYDVNGTLKWTFNLDK